MKKLSLTIVAAAAMFFAVPNANAQVEGEQEVMEQTAQQEEWQQIEATELPAEVNAAIERDFAGATVTEVHVKEKEGAVKYKLAISTADGQSKKLYADAQGNWIDKAKKSK